MTETGAASEPKSEVDKLRDELHLMKTAGIIEVAVRNPSVADYMNHWEGRALKAEAALGLLPAPTQIKAGETADEDTVAKIIALQCYGGHNLDRDGFRWAGCVTAARQIAVLSPKPGETEPQFTTNWNGDFDEQGYAEFLRSPKPGETSASDPICVRCASQEHGSPPLPEECTCGDYPIFVDVAITDAMVETVAVKFMANQHGVDLLGYPDGTYKSGILHSMRLALETARLSALSKGNAEGVKALEWEKVLDKDGEHNGDEAKTSIGDYLITVDPFTYNPTTAYYVDGPLGFRVQCSTPAEAKAAAQRDYETRILSALIPSPISGEVAEGRPVERKCRSCGAREGYKHTLDCRTATGTFPTQPTTQPEGD